MPRREARRRSRCSKACSGRHRAGRRSPRGRRPRRPTPRRTARALFSSSTAVRRSPSCIRAQASPDAGAYIELDRVRRGDGGACLLEGLDRLLVAVALRKRLGAREHCFDAPALVGRDAVGEESRVDVEPLREPLHCLGGRARLAALDLADVLLREAIAGELGLRQPGGDAQQAKAVAEPRARVEAAAAVVRWVAAVSSFMAAVYLGSLSEAGSGVARVPLCGDLGKVQAACASGEANVSRNHLTELLDFLGHGSYSETNLHRAGRQARV